MTAAPAEEHQQAFARIEAEVDRGNTDLSGLGFWRLVRQVKLEPRLAEHWADVIGRIDRKAFELRVRPRFPVWLGNAVLLVGSGVLIALIPVAIVMAGLARKGEGSQTWAGVFAVLAAGGLSVTLHDLAHWMVGRLAGIRFTAYFFKGLPLMQPGLKIDYATYLRTSPGARAWMHASGAIASKLVFFAVFAAVYLPHRASGYALFPAWALWTLLGLGVFSILTDVAFSTRTSDWKRFRRERRVARAIESIPRR